MAEFRAASLAFPPVVPRFFRIHGEFAPLIAAGLICTRLPFA